MKDTTEKLSALMDGELQDNDKLLQQLASDEDMKQTWQRYHLARDVMKGQLSDFVTLDVSKAVSESLKSEPVILTPIWQRLNPRYVMKQAAGLAVAAAVGTIAVLSVQQAQLQSTDNNTIAQVSKPTIQTQVASAPESVPQQIRQVSFTTREKLDAAVESKLSGYLVNHNEFSNAVRVSGVMPYTRIVGYVPAVSPEQVKNDK